MGLIAMSERELNRIKVLDQVTHDHNASPPGSRSV